MARKKWLDNIRWATVILVLVYHVFYIFNGVGVPGGFPSANSFAAMDTFCTVVYPWFMVLLFLVSGISTRYALQNRTKKQYIKDRAIKLLVPSTLGLFVIHWVTGYLNMKIGGGLDYIPGFLVYPISALSGIGPLWFIQMLFLFSCVMLLIPRQTTIPEFGTVVSTLLLVLLFFVIWGSAQILNVPVLTMYRFGIYFVSFLIGYFLLSQEWMLTTITRLRIPLLLIALVSGSIYTVIFNGSNYADSSCLQHWLTNLYLWSAVLAIIAWCRQYADRGNRFVGYMTRNSFGFYILHYPILMVCCYFLEYHTTLPMAAKYSLALLCMFVLTWMLNEGIKHIPLIRVLVLGMKRGKRHEV